MSGNFAGFSGRRQELKQKIPIALTPLRSGAIRTGVLWWIPLEISVTLIFPALLAVAKLARSMLTFAK